MGHCFEFVLADTIANYYRHKLGSESVFLNIGLDEHGQKVATKAKELGFENPKDYCDSMAVLWMQFCTDFHIQYDSFYRTTDPYHIDRVQRFYLEHIKCYTYNKNYQGKYCIGCESFITDKEINDGKCTVHPTLSLSEVSEYNTFFELSHFAEKIKDVLVDKSLSNELANLINEPFDLSISRENINWGVPVPDGSGDTFYVWFDALLNYLFAIGFYGYYDNFKEFWEDSLQICGKDNLKFQAYIFQSFLLAAGIPQTKEILVHGLILDESGNKMSKSIGNVIDPTEELKQWGILPLRYYLLFGINTFKDSKYSSDELISLWTNDIVNGLGNTIARVLHMIDTRQVKVVAKPFNEHYKSKIGGQLSEAFEAYDFKSIREIAIHGVIAEINANISKHKPYSKDCANYESILNDMYWELDSIIWVYKIIFKEMATDFDKAFEEKKKSILFSPILKTTKA